MFILDVEGHEGEDVNSYGQRSEIHSELKMIRIHLTSAEAKSSNEDGQSQNQSLIAQADKNALEAILPWCCRGILRYSVSRLSFPTDTWRCLMTKFSNAITGHAIEASDRGDKH